MTAGIDSCILKMDKQRKIDGSVILTAFVALLTTLFLNLMLQQIKKKYVFQKSIFSQSTCDILSLSWFHFCLTFNCKMQLSVVILNHHADLLGNENV